MFVGQVTCGMMWTKKFENGEGRTVWDCCAKNLPIFSSSTIAMSFASRVGRFCECPVRKLGVRGLVLLATDAFVKSPHHRTSPSPQRTLRPISPRNTVITPVFSFDTRLGFAFHPSGEKMWVLPYCMRARQVVIHLCPPSTQGRIARRPFALRGVHTRVSSSEF